MPLAAHHVAPGQVALHWSLRTGVAQAWHHLTSLDAMPTWLGTPVDGELRQGSTVAVDHGGGDVCRSHVTRVQSRTRVEMTWEFPDEPPSRLRLELVPEDERRCRLSLTHADLGSLAPSYLPGWVTHLTYFEASLEGHPLPPGQFWRIHDTVARLMGTT